jgi:hypothetical protein
MFEQKIKMLEKLIIVNYLTFCIPVKKVRAQG